MYIHIYMYKGRNTVECLLELGASLNQHGSGEEAPLNLTTLHIGPSMGFHVMSGGGGAGRYKTFYSRSQKVGR